MARVRKEEAEYQSLYNLRNMMRAEKDLNLLLDFIVEESANIVDADRASLFLLDDKNNELWSKIALGVNEIMRFSPEKGITGEVFKSGKVINVTDAYSHKKFNPAIDKKTGYKTSTVLCVPLKNIQGETIGVLQVLNKREGLFTSDDEDMLEIFASNAAVAIGNAQLIKNLSGTKSHLERENKVLKEKSRGKFFVNYIIGTSPKISEVVKLIEKIAGSPLDVLITGESGTGKELAARMIHYNSPRSEKAFIDINCAALPDSILESELFGIEKGVATGVDSRAGKVEMADRGTLFLDEIGDMSLAAQAKLLRALQERKITRLGGKKGITVDFRVIAATNKDLREEIKNNSFREDLFYRLNVVHIEMPNLRDIREDIQVIATHFLHNYSEEFGKVSLRFSKDAIERFKGYSWPGNVRELENEVKRSIIISEGSVIQEGDLSEHIREYKADVSTSLPEKEAGSSLSMKKTVEEIEIRMINDALLKTGGNKQKASELLGLTRQGLFKKMKRYSMS
jgi:Nif-specific regulatory protein